MDPEKKVLVVGSSGFIGSNLVKEALHQGYNVYAGIRESSNLQLLPKNEIQLIEFDLSSPAQIKSVLQDFAAQNAHFDFIIYNAGITYARKIHDFIAVNFQNTKNFTVALQESGMQFRKFLFVSSLSAFGPGDVSFTPIEVSHPKNPISTYGKSKLMAEKHIASLNNFPHLIINPTAVYGPGDKDFLKFISLVNSGFEFHLGRSKQMLSMIYVKDLVRVMIHLLESRFVNRSYLVSDLIEYDRQRLVEVIKSILNKKTIKIRFPAPLIKTGVRFVDSIYELFGSRPFLNAEKLAEMTTSNWICNAEETWEHANSQPAYSLEKGMKETIDWYKENSWL